MLFVISVEIASVGRIYPILIVENQGFWSQIKRTLIEIQDENRVLTDVQMTTSRDSLDLANLRFHAYKNTTSGKYLSAQIIS